MQLEFHQLDRRWEHLRVRRPERQRRLLASWAATGQQTPIVVVEVAGEPGRYLVIDGYQRVAALAQLGRDTVEGVVWPLREAEALVLDRSLRMSERETALEEGWLLAELEQRFGYGLEELARRFDRSVSWVSRRLALVELLPEAVQQQVRTGAIAAHVAMKYLVPMARANAADCQRMAAAVARHPYSSRAAGQLYAAWRAASPSVRERMLAEPQRFLQAQRQVEQKPPAGPAGTPPAELLRDLEMVAAIAHRASRRLAGAAQLMDGSDRSQARRQVDRTIDQLRRLATKLSEEQPHVEPQSTHDDSGTGRSGSPQARDRAGAGSQPAVGAPRAAVPFGGGAGVGATGEGRALPPADPGADAHLQGEPGPGP